MPYYSPACWYPYRPDWLFYFMDARAEPCLVLTVREEKDGEYEILWAPGDAGVRPARWGMHLNTHRTLSCVCFVSMSNFRWHSRLSVTESFILLHILSHPSSPLHSNRPRLSKCRTFVARMYPRVLVYWFAVFQRRCTFSTPSNSSLSAVDPRFYIYALTILLPFDCAFHHRFLHSHFQDVNSSAKQLPGIDVEEEWNIYILVSNIPCF